MQGLSHFLAMMSWVNCRPRAGGPRANPCSCPNGAAPPREGHIGGICFFLTLEITPPGVVCQDLGQRCEEDEWETGD